MGFIRAIKCRFGFHRLHSLKRLGHSEHIACQDCFRQFGINHDVRAILPWSGDLAEMYERHHGYKGQANFREWRAWVRRGMPVRVDTERLA